MEIGYSLSSKDWTYELKVKGDINVTSTIEINGNQYNGPFGWNYATTYILKVK